MWASKQKNRGFTIVELVIVIVVIGILAAITTITYRGTQDRARFGAYKSDLTRINEALTVYYSENGRYPDGDGAGSATCISGNGNFMPNATPVALAPSYINPMPMIPNYTGANYYAYCWNSTGSEYKLLRLVPSGSVPSIELNSSDITMDPVRTPRGWGFWSPGGSGL